MASLCAHLDRGLLGRRSRRVAAAMSQPIQAKWHARLENWALWLVSGQGKRGKSSMLDFGSTRHWSDILEPQPMLGPALDTDDLLAKMRYGDEDDRNRYKAVKAWYTWAGSPRDWAIKLDIHVDTLHDRVRSARYRLDDLDLLRRRSAVKPPMLSMLNTV